MDDKNRLKITLWLKPGIVRRMDGWLEEDNCKSRGEFAEKRCGSTWATWPRRTPRRISPALW